MVRVDLWAWPLAQPAARLRGFLRLLSPDEVARAGRFLRPADRDGFVAGRGRLREILAGYLGRSPQDIVFRYNDFGRPEVDGAGDLAFNLSHSGGRAALAVSHGAQPGLDIEAIRPIEAAVARHHFSGREYGALMGLAGADWLAGFYRCWTRKEAVIKALGQGLSMDLKAFDVTLGGDEPARLQRLTGGQVRDWTLVHLAPGPGLIGALAVETRGQGLRIVPCAGWPGGVSPDVPGSSQGCGWDQVRDGWGSHG